MASRLVLALTSALLLGAPLTGAQAPQPVEAKSQQAPEDNVLKAVAEAEAAAEKHARAALDQLRALDAKSVLEESSSWHTAEELEANTEKAFAAKREQAQKELEKRLQELEALPRGEATRNVTARVKELTLAAKKAQGSVDRVEKQQARAMLNDVRRAERAAMEHVRGLESSTRRAAREWKAAGRKVESATRKTRSAPERLFERAMEEVEQNSERLSESAEDAAEHLQGRVEEHFDRLHDQVEHRCEALQDQSDERREKVHARLSRVAETRMVQAMGTKASASSKAEGSSAKAFLEKATLAPGAKDLASFSAGLLLTLAGTALVMWRRPPAALSAAPPLLG